MENKIDVKLIGANGNTYNLMSLVKQAMKKNKIDDKVYYEMESKIKNSSSYNKALLIIEEYVNIV